MVRAVLVIGLMASTAFAGSAGKLLASLDGAAVDELEALARNLKTRNTTLAEIAKAVDDPKQPAASNARLLLLAVEQAETVQSWDRAIKLLERARAAADDTQLIDVHLAWARVEATRGRFESARNHLAAIRAARPDYASETLGGLVRWIDGPFAVTVKFDVRARRATIVLKNRSAVAWELAFTRQARSEKGFPGNLLISIDGRLFATSDLERAPARTKVRVAPGQALTWEQALEPGLPTRGIAEIEIPLVGSSVDEASTVREPLRPRFPFP